MTHTAKFEIIDNIFTTNRGLAVHTRAHLKYHSRDLHSPLRG